MPTLPIDRERCLELLARARLGRIAVTGRGPVPVVRPVNYVFDPRTQSVVFRAVAGSKLGALLRAGQAAFEIDEFNAERRTGWSVIVSGVCEPVRARAEVERLTALGLDNWHAGEADEWIRVHARTVSGRQIA
ncbi:MAG TPA: pyridoxamine 5'-phosphate oxidase family protein [Solirubrobacteraceae bacterium]|nr:pyridoxamine 5'-phosphate oxidase family protein [Solirubrobacteraceae bacterium]